MDLDPRGGERVGDRGRREHPFQMDREHQIRSGLEGEGAGNAPWRRQTDAVARVLIEHELLPYGREMIDLHRRIGGIHGEGDTALWA